MQTRRRWIGTLASISAALILFAAAAFGWCYYRFLSSPLIPANQSFTYVLKPGTSIRSLAEALTEQGYLPHPGWLIALAYWQGVARHLQAGEYNFTEGTTPRQLLQQIVSGKTVKRYYTLVEGWTFYQVMTALNANPYLEHTLTNFNEGAINTLLGLPMSNAEGLFFPATYYFIRGTTDVSVLRNAHNLLMKNLNREWQQRASGLPYTTPYQALIAASLIEKETALPQERALIAGIIVKRLQLNMPLQIDASVIYGLGSAYSGKLTLAELRQDTAYNTYLHRGLPPTPIAMPSLASIHAALHPEQTNLLYYVAKGDGGHYFSTNLQQHNEAVAIYQLTLHWPVIGSKNPNLACTPASWYLSKVLQSILTKDC